jgi:hypothetical protein
MKGATLKLPNPNKRWDGNREYFVKNLSDQYNGIVRSKKERGDKKSDLEKLFGKISYGQIGEAMKILERDTLLDDYYAKYSFLLSDFGFCLDIYDSLEIERFIKDYLQFREEDLYKKNLEDNAINHTTNGLLDFHKIYQILKYDVVDAFVGGGGGRRDDNVYGVIKLLELNFHTTLGFLPKLCSSQGTWGCDCSERAMHWMHYLEEKKLVKPDRSEPRSISNN